MILDLFIFETESVEIAICRILRVTEIIKVDGFDPLINPTLDFGFHQS